jgi:hypothetical protein
VGDAAGERTALLGMQDRVRDLTAQLKAIQRDNLTAENVRRSIFGLSDVSPDPPSWLAPKAAKTRGAPDVPCLMLSDLHWGETVDPAQMNGVNEYSLAVAQQRLDDDEPGAVAQPSPACRDFTDHLDDSQGGIV